MYDLALTSECIMLLARQVSDWLSVSLDPERIVIPDESGLTKVGGKFAVIRWDSITPVDTNVQVSRDVNNLEQTSMEFRVRLMITLYRGEKYQLFNELTRAAMTFRKPEAYWKFFGQYPTLGHIKTYAIQPTSVPIDYTEWEHRCRVSVEFSFMATESDIEPLTPIEEVKFDVELN